MLDKYFKNKKQNKQLAYMSNINMLFFFILVFILILPKFRMLEPLSSACITSGSWCRYISSFTPNRTNTLGHDSEYFSNLCQYSDSNGLIGLHWLTFRKYSSGVRGVSRHYDYATDSSKILL